MPIFFLTVVVAVAIGAAVVVVAVVVVADDISVLALCPSGAFHLQEAVECFLVLFRDNVDFGLQ